MLKNSFKLIVLLYNLLLQAKLNQPKPVMKTDVTVAGLTVTMR